MKDKKIIFIVGPTAVGKTDIAFYVARELDAEIISCDAMQVYREITIASNKPSPKILKSVAHHLLDIVSVTQEFDVATFNKKALQAMQDIHARHKIPIFTGGSGLYMEVLLDGIFIGGKKDIGFREECRRRIEREGIQALYAELKGVDPQAAKKIHPNDAKRVIRALEVFHKTGRRISDVQKERKGLWGQYDISLMALARPRKDLYARIDQRVEAMFNHGLVEEVERLSKRTMSVSARSIIGITEVIGFLNKEYDLERAKYLIKLNTRHYAKRQLTWLRREKRLQWMMINKETSSREVARHMVNELKLKIK